MSRYEDLGEGRPFLLLHGGGGPQTVAGFGALLAEHGRVIVPVHPGYNGTELPESLAGMRALAGLYLGLLEELDLRDVIVVGNSMGGWIGAEMAASGSARISGLVLVNAVGLEVEGEPVVDIFPLTPGELAKLSFHDPAKFALDPGALPEGVRVVMASNRAALEVYGAAGMVDSTLRGRLAGVAVPTAVLWGESDEVVTPAYGRAFAAAIPGATFRLLPETGHVPQVETPGLLLDAVLEFAGQTVQ
ncbi:MAG: alpha/beta hydrolase [Umezawaea sp.]